MLSANLTNQTRKAVYKRDGYRCALCDNTRGLQIHHIIFRAHGGSNDPANLIALCWYCHAEAHGTFLPDRHPEYAAYPADVRWALKQNLMDEYEQMCTEYICDYYAQQGIVATPMDGGGL